MWQVIQEYPTDDMAIWLKDGDGGVLDAIVLKGSAPSEVSVDRTCDPPVPRELALIESSPTGDRIRPQFKQVFVTENIPAATRYIWYATQSHHTIATTKTKDPKLTYVPRNSRPFTMRVSSVYGTEEGLKNTGMKVNPTWKWNMKDKSGALSIEYKKHCQRHNRHG